MEQQKYSFDSVTLKKVARGALIAGGGAVLTYVLQEAVSMDFGASTPIVVALLSIALNAVREYIKGV